MIAKNLVITPRAHKLIRRLPAHIQAIFIKQAKRLLENPRHPSLRNKRVQATERDWEFSITMNYRAVYRIEGNDWVVLLVGKHEDVF